MCIYVVGGEKGGVGKSTISAQIAAILASLKRRVLIIDADEKPGIQSWVAERPEYVPEIAVSFEPKRLKSLGREGFEDIVIDGGGGDTEVLREAMERANVLVTPFLPSQWDVWKARPVADMVIRARQKNPDLVAVAVVNRASNRAGRQHEGPEAQQALKQIGRGVWEVASTLVHDLKPFPACVPLGLAVHELGRPGTAAAEQTWALMGEIWGLAPDHRPAEVT